MPDQRAEQLHRIVVGLDELDGNTDPTANAQAHALLLEAAPATVRAAFKRYTARIACQHPPGDHQFIYVYEDGVPVHTYCSRCGAGKDT